jgi:hypothetical protein
MKVLIGLCHRCYCSNLQTELVAEIGLPLCLKCKILYEVNNISDTSNFNHKFRMELDTNND